MLNQTYPNWQLCIADGSTHKNNSSPIKQLATKDDRIEYIKVNGNLGISGNTKAALLCAKGDYVAFLDHDDVLPTWSLNEVAQSIHDHPEGDIFYSDEDRLSDNGKIRMTPLFKPDWSPDLFMSANYITHLFVIKKGLMQKLKGLRSEYDGSQDWDLALRALSFNPTIIHIPKILYHMRMAKGSTARDIGEKNYAHEAGKKAIQAYLSHKKIPAEVLEIPGRSTNFRLKYQLEGRPLISIIIPFKDKVSLIKKCLKTIEKSTYDNYELILISNNSTEKSTHSFLNKLKNNKEIKILNYDKPFNYSKINNFGRRNAKGKVLVFLNNDTEIITKEWLEELASVALRPEIGAVGPLLFYPDKTIQHAGVTLGMTGLAGHIFRQLKPGTLTYFWLPDWPRNYLAVTGACLAVEAKKFDAIKGFNEDFIVAGSDVVLCLNLFELGYINLYWPYVRLTHHESKSVGSYKNAPISDYNLSRELYKPYLNYKDPYFNPNLSLDSEIPELREKYEE